MLSMVDKAQQLKYQKMLGLTNFDSNTQRTALQAQATILGSLFISSTSFLINNLTILSDLNVSNNSIHVNNVNVKSNLTILETANILNVNISNNTILQSNIIISSTLSSLSLSTNNFYNNNITINSVSYLNNNINISNIYQNSSLLSIFSNTINIGNSNSIINILGTSNYFAINEIKIIDKVIGINSNNLSQISSVYSTNGSNCGINIESSSGIGFIKTSTDGSYFLIKAPMDSKVRTITTVDYDNNLSISGVSILYNAASVMSNLYVNGKTVFQGNAKFMASVLVSGSSLFNNDVVCVKDALISGNTNFNSRVTMSSAFNVNGKGLLYGNTTFISDILILGNSNVKGSITILSNLNINGNSILGGTTTLYSNIYVSSISIINGQATLNSSLNVKKNSNIFGTTTIMNNLYISSNTLLQGTMTINNNLNIDGNVLINGKMTIGSAIAFINNDYTNYTTLYIKSRINSALPEYKTNQEALDNGVPIWGFYRTGGIIKICLDNNVPSIQLLGNPIVIINKGRPYIENGATASDTTDGFVKPFISIISGINPLVNLPINVPVVSNTLITVPSILSIGSYTINYTATDQVGNVGYAYRQLDIISDRINTSFINNIFQSWPNTSSSYNINSSGMDQSSNVSWTFTPAFLLAQGIEYDCSWSIVLRFNIISWDLGFEINFDPNLNNWTQGQTTFISNGCGTSNIQISPNQYFVSTDGSWNVERTSSFITSSIATLGNLNIIYMILSRNNNNKTATVAFYDNSGSLIDIATSSYFEYINRQSLFSITINSNMQWYKGFTLHKCDTNISLSEFISVFN